MKKAKLYFARHIRINENNYLHLVTALVAGIAAGAFVVGCLDESLKAEISVILQNYGAAMNSGGIATRSVLYDNIVPVFQQMAVLAVCGMTPLALSAGVLLLGAKGFATGFFIAACACCLQFKEAALMLLSSAPYQMLSVMVLIAASGVAAAHVKMCEKKSIYALEMGVLLVVYIGAVMLDFVIKNS